VTPLLQQEKVTAPHTEDSSKAVIKQIDGGDAAEQIILSSQDDDNSARVGNSMPTLAELMQQQEVSVFTRFV